MEQSRLELVRFALLSYPQLFVYCSTVVETSMLWGCSALTRAVLCSWGRSFCHGSQLLARHLSRASTDPFPIQVLLGAHGIPPPAHHLSQLVGHELLFQVVVQVAHLPLGLVRGFHLMKNRGGFGINKSLRSKRHPRLLT